MQEDPISSEPNTEAPLQQPADEPSNAPIASETTTTTQQSPELPKKSKKRPSKLVLLLIAVIVLLVGAVVWFALFNKKDEATPSATNNTAPADVARYGIAVGLVEGTAEFSTDKGNAWQKLTSETEVSEGTQVRTGTDGRVVLIIDDGSAVRLAYNSSLELTNLATTSIVVTNLTGELYNRVVPAASRTYQVVAAQQSYTAKGTAFRTYNSDTKKGVEVFQSTVAVKQGESDVSEGNAFFSLTDQKEKENKVTAIDLTALKNDDFIKWNSEQDKKNPEFVKTLGVLTELDKPNPTPAPVKTPTTATAGQKNGIVLSGSVSDYSANFSWKVTGVDTSKGYKLVKSKSSQTPTYPDDSTAFIEAGKTSYNLYLGDGKTYYFRICAYRGSTCDSYSNAVTIQTAVKPKAQIEAGAVTLNIAGNTASWTFAGTAPYGFKLVLGTSAAPTYPSKFNKFADGTSTTLPEGLVSGTTYYARVCKYNDGDCQDYSNEITYIAP